MNLASVLIKKIIAEKDADAWTTLQSHYLPSEYERVFKVIQKHFETYSTLPSFDDLKLSIRDKFTLEKIFLIEKSDEIDIPNIQLLDYLKNEYTQDEILNQLDKYLDNSVAVDNAEESIGNLQAIVLDLESKVDLKTPDNDMRRLPLFETPEELEKHIPLTLNTEYDGAINFSPRDLILIGGKRGHGKSLACTNIAANLFNSNESVIYFTIEMDARTILQRICAISSEVNMRGITYRDLSIPEWERVAKWWSNRFETGEENYKEYLSHRSFDKLHESLTKKPLKNKQIDVIYDPVLSLAKIRSEIDKKVISIKPKVIIVDYLNQIKRHIGGFQSRYGQYEWTEQIEVSKALKSIAQQYEVPVIAPYQIDATGEARFAKGILDAADAAFTINRHKESDNCITFNCAKMRNAKEAGFTSVINWETLKIGPESARNPDDIEEASKTGEAATDI